MMDISVNLTQLLRTTLPTEVFYWETVTPTSSRPTPPDRCVKVSLTGGLSKPWLKYTEAAVQVLVRDLSKPGASKLAKLIFDLLHGRFGLILPAATVDGYTYAAVKTAEIKAIMLPYNIGQDEAGRTSYTTNYIIIYEEA